MNRKPCFIFILGIMTSAFAFADKPNIIFMMCDDLGYGDVSCLNPTGKIPTPHIDRLAKEGMTYTDAHSGSSVCTPTRYGLLTGRYSWRTRLQKGVVQGFAPCLIAPDRLTVAGLLQQQGYHTGIVGKWHLDFQYADPETNQVLNRNKLKLAPVGSRIPDGPLTRGFDYFHGFHHARDMEGVIDGDTVIEHDDVVNMLPRTDRQSVAYIEARAKDKKPFFLYIPYGSPHTPIVPTPEWAGKNPMGSYADFVMQNDAAVGNVLDALDRTGLTANTLVIFTSDNGCSKAARIPDMLKHGHRVSGPYRGSKADIWDGGHRVPFLVRWPGKIKAGTTCTETICHVDFMATVADLLRADLPGKAAEDSVSYLPTFSGGKLESKRAGIVHHSVSGHFAYRSGKWKLILARASGGWTSPKENEAGKDTPKAQLYDMIEDFAETNNLYDQHPEIVQRLLKQLESDVFSGRSTSGPVSKNDVAAKEIILWKSERRDTNKSNSGKKRNSKKS